MAPKKFQQPESSDSEDGGMNMMGGGGADFTRFTNPNYSREFMATLPSKIRDRTKVLLAMDDKGKAIVNDTKKDTELLRRKFEAKYASLFARRKEIVNGNGDAPTDAEVAKGFPEDHKDVVSTKDGNMHGAAEDEQGLPNFWLESLQHHVIIDEMITERDEQVLEHLTDISAATLDPNEHPGFSIVFTFAPNEFFEETSLNKTFFWKQEFGETTIDHTSETKITWKAADKNTTVETVTKKQKSKSKKGAVRYVTSSEPCESFFNFFTASEDPEEAEQWCSLALTVREKVVPLAVEYFTGEAPDGSSDIDDDEDYDEEDDEEDDEDEDDEPEMPMTRGRGRGGGGGGRGGGGAQPPAAGRGGKQAPDCKQQ